MKSLTQKSSQQFFGAALTKENIQMKSFTQEVFTGVCGAALRVVSRLKPKCVPSGITQLSPSTSEKRITY